uniref:Uncharacterized protein n=1 Tax=Molossus molossus TaxID=27622 RepID=A0A7J8IZ35_MOLMO|nr:hypothetical protein HJG59_010259 [Molossus molossus]
MSPAANKDWKAAARRRWHRGGGPSALPAQGRKAAARAPLLLRSTEAGAPTAGLRNPKPGCQRGAGADPSRRRGARGHSAGAAAGRNGCSVPAAWVFVIRQSTERNGRSGWAETPRKVAKKESDSKT